ncbi:hypothetical protein ElyMa_004725100 [Elysia marginata]|uniref:Secreted protein n=1 Tax=Elysia marginata TaxID=1093978 RepID=A0AAV4IDG4_9GAST|nr:hypothetical protein ElyMa_004725100 [Elysia marginata]
MLVVLVVSAATAVEVVVVTVVVLVVVVVSSSSSSSSSCSSSGIDSTSAPWITPAVKATKQKQRQAERQWRKLGTQLHRDIYIDHKRTQKVLLL